MESKRYIRLDGDDIGDKIELLLLQEEYDKAQNVHDSVQKSLEIIREKIKKNPNAEILMFGCDDILFIISNETDYKQFLEEIRSDFFKGTKSTLSVGIGNTLMGSINSLRRAKLSGKNTIVEER